MDALTLSRLRAHLRSPGLARKLGAEVQLGGEKGRNANERLGRASAPRPDEPLVWCHVPGAVELAALTSLRERLDEELAGASLLVTSPDVLRCREAASQSGLLCQLPPIDTPAVIQRFLDHWTPDAAIWFDQVKSPLLLEAAAKRGMPLVLQNATAPLPHDTRSSNLERHLLGLFDRIFALDRPEFEALRALGAVPARVEVTGRLTALAHPPRCLETEREVLARAMQGRPAWLAVCPDEREMPAILAAQRVARRTAHRLLLILVPREEIAGPDLARSLREGGWNVARREADEDPDEATDIFLADCHEEMGLYYRLAPVTFLGGSLADGEQSDASHPATLGSAIVAGPFSGGQAEIMRRLRRGRACRLVSDGGQLGEAVTELLAPDRAAQLALNAWDIASDGGPILDRLTSVVISAIRARDA